MLDSLDPDTKAIVRPLAAFYSLAARGRPPGSHPDEAFVGNRSRQGTGPVLLVLFLFCFAVV